MGRFFSSEDEDMITRFLTSLCLNSMITELLAIDVLVE